ncbi:MAG: hypothetical protein KY469_02990 [Actinobacteria bacterium]|nr:hypothetical protein [Actinomycetota bacterium]
MKRHILTRLLTLDAAANVLAGAVVTAASGWLADQLGLSATWPVVVVGLGLVAYGLENLLVARRPTAGGVVALATIDLAFAVVVLTLAIADPTSAEAWSRWTLGAVADLSAVFGIAKLLGVRSLRREPVRSAAR